jgi:hypothetical protein
MRAPVHDDGQIEAVFARLAKPVNAPGGAWVSQFSAVSEGVRRAISSSPQCVICFAPLLEGHPPAYLPYANRHNCVEFKSQLDQAIRRVRHRLIGYEGIRRKHFQIGIVESPDNQQLSGRWQLPTPEEGAAKPKERGHEGSA